MSTDKPEPLETFQLPPAHPKIEEREKELGLLGMDRDEIFAYGIARLETRQRTDTVLHSSRPVGGSTTDFGVRDGLQRYELTIRELEAKYPQLREIFDRIETKYKK